MSNAYKVVKDFEKTIAEYAGAKYGVAVSSCCNAIFLCLEYYEYLHIYLSIPKHTYPGVAMAIINSGNKLMFDNRKWNGIYDIKGTYIIDGALRFRKGMYEKNSFHCLSFHHKKHLPIGRGGMILTDDKDAYNWLKMARFDGRKEIPLHKDNATVCGWNMYLTPEQAARGLTLFDDIKNKKLPDLKVEDQNYPDLSKWEVFQ